VNNKKIGRNDLCPCGSGKKYKKCCGRLEGIVNFSLDPFERHNQLMSAVKIKLDEYYKKEIKKLRRDMQRRFLFFSVDKILPPEHESFFSDCLWFDYEINGKSPGRRYLEENGAFMETALRNCLEALNESYLSVYQFLSSNDNYMQLKDLFSGHEYRVILKEAFDAGDKEKEIILLGRLLNVPEGHIFSGMVLLLENESRQKDFVQEHFAYLKELKDRDTISLLKGQGEIIYGIFDHALKKTFMNLNDIRAISIDENNRLRLLDELSMNKEYTFIHKTDGVQWYAPSGECHGYVRIAVSAEHLLICADTLQDVLQLREFINTILPGKEHIKVNSLFRQAPPMLEVSDLWFTVLKDQETERWLTTVHEELGNKTPEEILKEDKGQEQLMNLLNRFEESLSNPEEQELITYMKLRISPEPLI